MGSGRRAGIAAALLYWLLPFGDDGAELRLLLAVPGGVCGGAPGAGGVGRHEHRRLGRDGAGPLLFAIVNLGGRRPRPVAWS